MSDIAIKVSGLSKQYMLGERSLGTVSQDLNRWWYRIRGKEDPYLKIGDTNDRTVKGDSNFVWVLNNLDFEVKKGEAVGIIGRNGAGKSTLLKLLSRITSPTLGEIKINGRINALLEVGTGFHPELTGRENIYLNGAIMGMTRKEITRKMDEIIDFSGCEKYIDTPVKRYSSGMTVRLGFAVAAHLESEILIVDEVLAVGDAEFQKKCLGKMNDVSRNEGRTVLFVSHNMGSVSNLCQKGIYLNRGELEFEGNMDDTISKYLMNNHGHGFQKNYNLELSPEFTLIDAKLLNSQGTETNILVIEEDWKLILNIEIKKPIKEYVIGFGLLTLSDMPINTSWSEKLELAPGNYQIGFDVVDFPLQSGQYKLVLGISHGVEVLLFDEDFLTIDIANLTKNTQMRNVDGSTGIFASQFKATINRNENT